ncbi:NHL repeat-containing protein [Actinocorallia populi]|uniref:hypothetical protein n=1 Tax=Actinocorallia populi TaxID=2079200 RepID=UPI0013002A56|nr:hypothetical protein [Actinocorallia populi]
MRRTLIVAAAALAVGMLAPAAYAEERPWRVTRAPQMVPDSGLSHVAALGPEEVWVGGYAGQTCYDWSIPFLGAGTTCNSNTTLKRWNGTFWETKNPPVTWNYELADLDASASGNVWVSGMKNGQARIFRWDGKKWNEIALPAGDCPSTASRAKLQLTAAGTDEAWASWGGRCVFHWKAGEWAVHAVPDDFVHDVHVTASNEVYLVGHKPLRRDGNGWVEAEGASEGHLLAVDDDALYYYSSPDRTVKRVSDGGTTALPPAPEIPTSVLATRYLLDAEGALWRVDENTVHRFDGTAWRSASLPVDTINAVDPLPGALWAVGTAPGDKAAVSLTNG